MRKLLTSAGEIAGMATASVGLWLAWRPLGVIGAGVAVFAVSYMAGAE